MGRFIPAAPDCLRTRSPKYAIDRIVIHAQDGTQAGTIAWFQKAGRSPPTATHYLISRTGDIVQMVPDKNKAIHAGSTVQAGWNDRSLGIEFEVRVRPWTGRKHFPENEWTEAMLAAGAKVVRVLCDTYSIPIDREHIVGHSEIPGVDHVDPGEGFDWPNFIQRVHGA